MEEGTYTTSEVLEMEISESDFSEEEYPSKRLSLSSPKKARTASNSEDDRGITIIRGRNYSLSPHKSPIKRKTTLASKTSKHVISFEVDEQHEGRTKKRENKGKSSTSAKKAELIDCYGSEADSRVRKNESSRVAKTQPKKEASVTKEVVFSSSERGKWQPIPQETLTLLNNIVMAALEQSTGDLRGATKRQAEKQIQRVIREVNAELKVSMAPRSKQPKMTSKAMETVNTLKAECVALVQRNGELEERLAERTRVINELKTRTDQLQGSVKQRPEAAHQSTGAGDTGRRETEVLRERNNFQEYISKLLDPP